MNSIKWRLLTPIAIVVSIMVVVLASVSYGLAQQALVEKIDEANSQAIAGLQQTISAQLEKWTAQVRLLASLPAAQTMDWSRVYPFLEQNMEQLTDFEIVFLADRTGAFNTTLHATGNIGDRDYFAPVMAGETVVSQPVVSKSTNEAIVVIAAPVRSQSGQVIGLMAGTITLTRLTTLVNQVEFGAGGYALMTDSTGLVVAHPEQEMVLAANLLESDQPSMVALTQRMIAGESGVEDYTYDGVNKRGAFGPVPELGCALLAVVNEVDLMAPVNRLAMMITLVGAASLALIVVLIYLFTSKMVAPVVQMAKQSSLVAAGDFTQPLSVSGVGEIGELGTNFGQMIAVMRQLITQAGTLADSVSNSAQEMAASSQEAGQVSDQIARTVEELARGAADQSAAAADGNGLVESIVTGLGGLAETMGQLSQLIENAIGSVQVGLESIDKQQVKMTENASMAHAVGTAVNDLANKSERIGSIVESITQIARQTNLLALNAAIEAARAGEQGRGFAVVAEEVRRLAEQSAVSATQISQLIEEMRAGVAHAVEEMVQAGRVVEEQKLAVNESATSFNEIADSMNQVESVARQTMATAQELNQQAGIVGDRIGNIAAIVQQAAAGTEEVSASTEEQTAAMQELAALSRTMAEQAAQLQSSIRRFQI